MSAKTLSTNSTHRGQKEEQIAVPFLSRYKMLCKQNQNVIVKIHPARKSHRVNRRDSECLRQVLSFWDRFNSAFINLLRKKRYAFGRCYW
eukprot:4456641-Ditylum_brightwellii.AAC.2